jgi:hypothetical protein
MTGAEIIRIARKQGIAAEVFLGKLHVHAEREPDEALVRLLRNNRQAVIDALLEAETEPDRWRRLLAEKIETVVKMRGLPRRDAETEAFRDVVIGYLNETHPATDPRVCTYCGKPDLLLTPNLPLGVGHRHAWLHQHCAQAWREGRRKAAEEALGIMGIVEPAP